MKFALLTAGMIAMSATTAQAAFIAGQDFNALDSSNSNTTDSITDGSALTNGGSFNNGGTGLDFSTIWNDTRGVTNGPVTATSDSSDFIGVSSFTGSNAPDVSAAGVAVAAGSEHNFQFNDGDGRLDLTFEAVDVSAYTNVELSLNYWIADTGFESTDTFSVTVTDGVNDFIALDFSEPEMEGNASADDGTANWNNLLVDISNLISQGFDATSIQLIVGVDTNSGSENVFVDDIAFTGVIPAPGALALLGMAGIGARRRRRA